MILGYARVSTIDQNHRLQIDALKEAECARIYEETASGARVDRPELMRLLDNMRAGDELVVWKLDRLARSTRQLIETIELLRTRDIAFRCLTQDFNTSTSSGRLVFTLFAALAEFERDLIRERTLAGLASARAQGIFGGRPSSMNEDQIAMARQLLADGENWDTVRARFGVSRSTFYAAGFRKHLPTLHPSSLAANAAGVSE